MYVGNTSRDDYDQYVSDCVKSGFNVDYVKGEKYYVAENSDGYRISLEYNDDDELVEVTPQSIRLRKRTLSATQRRTEVKNK